MVVAAYDPASVARDTGVKAALKAAGSEARSFAGHLLHEPWTVETGQGGFYRVFTPYWRAVRDAMWRARPRPAASGAGRPAGPRRTGWRTGAWAPRCAGGRSRGAHQAVGEAAAEARLAAFPGGPVARYARRGTAGGGRHLAPVREPDLWRDRHPRGLGTRRCARRTRAGRGRDISERAGLARVQLSPDASHAAYHQPQLEAEWDAFPGAATIRMPNAGGAA
jgi:deoxyribodipyrimidine photo-lyase